MVQKESIVTPVDKCGILSVNVFHVYKNSVCIVGGFNKVSVRRVLFDAKLKSKSKIISILVRSKFRYVKNDGTTI
jgi:ribosomal protein L14